MDKYDSFIASKRRTLVEVGIGDVVPHHSLFDHQRVIVEWACRMGRCCIFADTGLGKTRMQLDWADKIAAHTGKPVLLLAPLAVGEQTIREAEEMGILATKADDPDTCGPVRVLNYDRIHKVSPGDYSGVVLDESSILKAVDGKTRKRLTEMFADTAYRLACSATPAPNDHTELGNHSAFLGLCTREEMLAEYFVHDGGSTSDWRLKGHARQEFWRWVSSWAVMLRKPSDLGFDNGRYDLPPIVQKVVHVDYKRPVEEGMMFATAAVTLTDQRNVRRASLEHRCKAVLELIESEPDEQWLVWCETNTEGDALSKLIPNATQVAGVTPPEAKKAAMLGFAAGKVPILVTKAKIAGFGMNWQSCARMVFVGATHSYEQWYQAVRRCWRFGQTRSVHVYMIETTADSSIVRNLRRKAENASQMAAEMAAMVSEHQLANLLGQRPGTIDNPTNTMRIPAWLRSES